MMRAYPSLGSLRKCSTNRIDTNHAYSNQFEELCYKHLLFGQCKQQSFANWLNTTQETRDWNISIRDQTFTLNPGRPTAIEMPLQLIGSHCRDSNVFRFAYQTQEFESECPEITSVIKRIQTQCTGIPEFETASLEDCGDNIGYILSSMVISALDIDAYYVGYGHGMDGSDDREPSTMMFVLLNELETYTNYKESEWMRSDLESLMNSWDYTFNHLCTKSHLL